MGGNIAWTIRLEDSTEYRMERWTNIFPEVTMDDTFLLGSPLAFEDAMRSWFAMKQDWEDNKDTGQFRENMTSVYAPYPNLLAPSEYGLVVTDFVSKTIISCNGYTSLERVRVYISMLEGRENELRNYHTNPPVSEQKKHVEWLYNQGRIHSVGWRSGHIPVAPDMAFDDVLKQAFTLEPEPGSLSYVYAAPPKPWTIEDYTFETSEGWERTYQRVKDLGFVLSPQEHKGFADTIKRWAPRKARKRRA